MNQAQSLPVVAPGLEEGQNVRWIPPIWQELLRDMVKYPWVLFRNTERDTSQTMSHLGWLSLETWLLIYQIKKPGQQWHFRQGTYKQRREDVQDESMKPVVHGKEWAELCLSSAHLYPGHFRLPAAPRTSQQSGGWHTRTVPSFTELHIESWEGTRGQRVIRRLGVSERSLLAQWRSLIRTKHLLLQALC